MVENPATSVVVVVSIETVTAKRVERRTIVFDEARRERNGEG